MPTESYGLRLWNVTDLFTESYGLTTEFRKPVASVAIRTAPVVRLNPYPPPKSQGPKFCPSDSLSPPKSRDLISGWSLSDE